MTDSNVQGGIEPSLQTLVSQLRELISDARGRVLRSADAIQVRTCWEIGRHIVEFEQGGAARAEYGKRLLPKLAESLTAEFGRGFDTTNLRHMRGFFGLSNSRHTASQIELGALRAELERDRALLENERETRASLLSEASDNEPENR